LMEIAKGMEYLHAEEVLHGDLKVQLEGGSV
jgi:serine/threonine protein kinase